MNEIVDRLIEMDLPLDVTCAYLIGFALGAQSQQVLEVLGLYIKRRLTA